MNALKLSATRRRKQVVILNCLLSKPTPLSTPKRSAVSASSALKAAAVLCAVALTAVAAALAAADILVGKVLLLLAAGPVVYFCLKGGDK